MKRAIFFCLFISFGLALTAQTNRDSLRLHKKVWVIETSVVWPIYPGIYKVNFARELWAKKTFSGELGLSLNIQPERTDPAGDHFSEEFISVFYRQFFWKGFHIQIDNNFAYGRLNNYKNTGVNYESYAIFHDFLGAYRFELLKKHKISLTITPQAGGGFTSYTNNSWPRAELPFWEVNLLVGMRF
jgi:hypothetical protein